MGAGESRLSRFRGRRQDYGDEDPGRRRRAGRARRTRPRALSSEGYEVTFARDGRETLAAVENDEPDAAVLDVMMPPPDGLEVCRRLRAADNTLPILMLTAQTRGLGPRSGTRRRRGRLPSEAVRARRVARAPARSPPAHPGGRRPARVRRRRRSTRTPTWPGAAVLDCNSRAPSSRCSSCSCARPSACSRVPRSWSRCGASTSARRPTRWRSTSVTCGASWRSPTGERLIHTVRGVGYVLRSEP